MFEKNMQVSLAFEVKFYITYGFVHSLLSSVYYTISWLTQASITEPVLV